MYTFNKHSLWHLVICIHFKKTGYMGIHGVRRIYVIFHILKLVVILCEYDWSLFLFRHRLDVFVCIFRLINFSHNFDYLKKISKVMVRKTYSSVELFENIYWTVLYVHFSTFCTNTVHSCLRVQVNPYEVIWKWLHCEIHFVLNQLWYCTISRKIIGVQIRFVIGRRSFQACRKRLTRLTTLCSGVY